MVLIALHIAGALDHTLVMQDGLLRRMSVGRRFGGTKAAEPASTALGALPADDPSS
jgi:hypothetical protein